MDTILHPTALTEPDHALLQSAIDAADRLYVPGVQEVGAAVRTSDGQVFAGIHFETATGFANICGEVAAICCMVAAGHRDLDTAVAVWRDPDGRHFLLPPCGRCREVISDFNPQAWVIITTLATTGMPPRYNILSKCAWPSCCRAARTSCACLMRSSTLSPIRDNLSLPSRSEASLIYRTRDASLRLGMTARSIGK